MTLPYQYKALSPGEAKTRILEILPAHDTNKPLQCRLREIDIQTDPFYDALSYTWGLPHFTETLLVEDNGQWNVLRITPNLRDALFRFRRRLDVRQLWVDALCINQQDDDEKARQIPLMTQIYTRATSVLVWLGQNADGASCLQKVDKLSRGMNDPDDKAAIKQLLEFLLKLPWFGRRWIVQEVVLSPNVTLFCGVAEMSWLRLLQVVGLAWPSDRERNCSSVVKTMATIWRRQFIGGEFSSRLDQATGILNLLESFENLGCADPRDRIYALAGLSSDTVLSPEFQAKGEKVMVSYTVPVEQVYIDFSVRKFASLGGYNNIIRLAAQRSDGSHLNGKCSWIPDWRLPVIRQLTFERLPFIASHVSHNRKDNSLEITLRQDDDHNPRNNGGRAGYVYGSVQSVFDRFPLEASKDVVVRWLQGAWQFITQWMESHNPNMAIGPWEHLILAHQLERAIVQDGIGSILGKGGSWVGPQYNFDFNNSIGHKEFQGVVFNDQQTISKTKERDLSEIKLIMEGRTVFIFLPVRLEQTDGSPGAPQLPLGTRIPPQPPPEPHTDNLLWPAIAVGPSHTSMGDMICTQSIDVQRWMLTSISGPIVPNKWRSFECAHKPTFLLRPLNSSNNSFWYIGDAVANRLVDDGWDDRDYQTWANDHYHRLKKIIIQ
ncbi:heterokaryon incompatibility protein-domain-containing protein [Hypoxylon sp. FL0543]|nr:heterokaryon incompatibility protein-domain-containing protein [Hypoxylon sp. FL0543]